MFATCWPNVDRVRPKSRNWGPSRPNSARNMLGPIRSKAREIAWGCSKNGGDRTKFADQVHDELIQEIAAKRKNVSNTSAKAAPKPEQCGHKGRMNAGRSRQNMGQCTLCRALREPATDRPNGCSTQYCVSPPALAVCRRCAEGSVRNECDTMRAEHESTVVSRRRRPRG